MSINLNNPALFVKGTYNAKFFNPSTGDMVYYSNKLQTDNITSSINLGAINASIGNPTVIQIPDTPKLDLNMTAADFSLEGRALQTGGTVFYNAVTPVDEVVSASGTTLTVSQIPVAPYGSCNIECTINDGAEAYLIDPDTKQIQNFTATDGTNYCVHYYVNNPSAQGLAVNTMFAPSVVRALLKLPVYTKEGTDDALSSSLWGYLYITIPRLQFSGDVSTVGDQTNPATTVMNGTALSYDVACSMGLNCGDSASQSKLAYMVLVPVGSNTQLVQSLLIVGGEITVEQGQTVTVPVKYVMPDGSQVQPDLTQLNYQIEQTSTATVSTAGVVEGVAVGDTTLTVTVPDNTQLTVTCDVSVTSAGG